MYLLIPCSFFAHPFQNINGNETYTFFVNCAVRYGVLQLSNINLVKLSTFVLTGATDVPWEGSDCFSMSTTTSLTEGKKKQLPGDVIWRETVVHLSVKYVP